LIYEVVADYSGCYSTGPGQCRGYSLYPDSVNAQESTDSNKGAGVAVGSFIVYFLCMIGYVIGLALVAIGVTQQVF
jgi:hypothetical protein